VKIAVIGAKGMLGSALCRRLRPEHDVVGWDIEDIDITDRGGTVVRLADLGPHLIVNCAAWTDVDGCEHDPDAAWRINALGAQNLALAALAGGSSLLYVSTDYIFDGESDADYDEVAAPRPINVYGRSKLAGEILSRMCPRTYVVRTSWLFGHHPGNYVERIVTAGARDGVVRMPDDQLESPTYTVHLAQAIADLLAAGAYGCYHIANRGACTRAAFAEFVLTCAGRGESVEVIGAGGSPRPARRPRRVVLGGRMYPLVSGRPMPSWQDAVQEYFTRERQAT